MDNVARTQITSGCDDRAAGFTSPDSAALFHDLRAAHPMDGAVNSSPTGEGTVCRVDAYVDGPLPVVVPNELKERTTEGRFLHLRRGTSSKARSAETASPMR